MNGTMEATDRDATQIQAQDLKYANQRGYSDVEPFEIIRTITPKCLEIRAMNAVEEPEAQAKRNASFVAGGFVGHFENSLQRWIITNNEKGHVVKIRLGKKGWKDAQGNRYWLSEKPVKHYDFNF